ncbi:hypothetical protein [Noviherbaspirillum galbum]|uniref:Lipoprotein n=1 Tax=Noviherbaspirillum galbum TaxID=2709383 RepID=A0A6B3SM16_9BURK|nr:hypothetical protein [Noviherbaspirillum galbum]NEX61528.1 hypothetical protein [Noviherbaspirillum galbum]
MKTLSLTAVSLSIALLAGCANFKLPGFGDSEPKVEAPVRKVARNPDLPQQTIEVADADGKVTVQKVEFRSGVSSATVERLAQRFGCTGRAGAGLVTDKGPVEVYRLQCDNGTTFMAKCELRQCRPLR